MALHFGFYPQAKWIEECRAIQRQIMSPLCFNTKMRVCNLIKFSHINSPNT